MNCATTFTGACNSLLHRKAQSSFHVVQLCVRAVRESCYFAFDDNFLFWFVRVSFCATLISLSKKFTFSSTCVRFISNENLAERIMLRKEIVRMCKFCHRHNTVEARNVSFAVQRNQDAISQGSVQNVAYLSNLFIDWIMFLDNIARVRFLA